MEELVKKFVDAIVLIDEVINEFKATDAVPFYQAVAEEMRQRGMSEERIANALKGAAWGEQNWIAVEQEIKSTPSILDVKGGRMGQVEGST